MLSAASSKGMSGLLRNMGWMTLPNLIVKPAWFLFITLVCIRYMGLAEYGVMTAALALMSICDGSLTLGSSPYTIRELARDPSRSSQFFSNLLVSRTFFSLIAIAIGLGIRTILDTGALDVVLFAGLEGAGTIRCASKHSWNQKQVDNDVSLTLDCGTSFHTRIKLIAY